MNCSSFRFDEITTPRTQPPTVMPTIATVRPPVSVTTEPPIRLLERKSAAACDRYAREYSVLTYHILGGEETTLGDFPHMAALGYPSIEDGTLSWNCGGSLVAENFILTAAHCLTRQQPTVVKLGQVNLAAATPEDMGVDVPIAEIILHPDYVPSRNYHDIALLRLANNVTMTENVYPACLRAALDDVPDERWGSKEELKL